MQFWTSVAYSQVRLIFGKHGKRKRGFRRPVWLFSLGRWPLTQSINTVTRRKGIHSLASSQQCDFLSAHLCVCVHRRHLVILWEMFSLVRLLLALHCWGLNNEKLKSCCSCGRFKYKGCRMKKFLAKFGKSAFSYGQLQNSLLQKQLFPMTNVSHSHLHVCLWPPLSTLGKSEATNQDHLNLKSPTTCKYANMCAHLKPKLGPGAGQKTIHKKM